MAAQQPIFLIDIEDMHIEVVLDNGYWNTFASAADLHAHTCYELMLCPEGSLQIALADGTVIPMERDALCLVPPRVYHRILEDASTKKLAIRFLCTRNLRPGRVYGSFLSAMENKDVPILLGEQPELSNIARILCAELQQRRLAADACVQNLLSLLLIGLFRKLCFEDSDFALPPLPRQASDRRLAIEDFLNHNYTRPLTEEMLAEKLHLSKGQMNRLLRQLYGMRFRQLLIDIRLSRAVELLITTELPIAEIAMQVGYASASGFYEAFEKRYGIAPGNYKNHRHE